MPLSNLTPLSVVEYKEDYIINFVRHKTGWSERNEVSQKTQLIYLNRYLQSKSIECKTIVAEDEYIDRHFLEDYAEYYARCFPSHPRKCSRLHFFSETFDEHDFKEALANSDSEFNTKLQQSYLGFAVIRPIPHTFFAKLCLRPFGAHTSKVGRRVLRKQVSVSLFGISLTIDTIPFIEQDKVVSACATSALWTALSATKDTHVSNLPSPSAITKSATHLLNEAAKVFPTAGLTPPQVAKSLAHYGLAPTVVYLSPDNFIGDLKERIYAYISNETPLILGGDVYEKTTDGNRQLGKHLVCVVGYNMDESTNAGDRHLLSDAIDKIYIHDDRFGPFIKVKSVLEEFECNDKKKSGLVLQVDDVHDNYFIPDVLIIGLSHKVRIPYDHISAISAALQGYLQWATEDVYELLKVEADPLREKNEVIHESLRSMLYGVWDVSLVTSTKVKEELRDQSVFWSFNGLVNKTSLLLQNLPKHIWRCRIHQRCEDGNKLLTDVLFDATEIPQGRLMVGYISYSEEAQRIWHYVESQIRERVWQNYGGSSESKTYIGCVIKFFSELGNSATLNTMYGPLGLPRREMKPGETDDSQNIAHRTDVYTIRSGSALTNFGFLEKAKKYIWVINELGDIVIGEDVAKNNEFKGHPTLIDGKPGRIAGELFFTADDSSWKANLQSRAYSGHIKKNSPESDIYLNNVIQSNLAPLDCQKAT
jgi:hypothetical protein